MQSNSSRLYRKGFQLIRIWSDRTFMMSLCRTAGLIFTCTEPGTLYIWSLLLAIGILNHLPFLKITIRPHQTFNVMDCFEDSVTRTGFPFCSASLMNSGSKNANGSIAFQATIL